MVEEKTLSKIVYSFYDNKTAEFSSTRYKQWPSISKFITRIKKNDTFLDLGCGNGRHMISKNCTSIGVDTCLGFLKNIEKKEKSPLLIQSSIENLPLHCNIFSYILCSAVIHHLIDPHRGLFEIKRVMKRNAEALIVVWGDECLKSKKIREIKEFIVTSELPEEKIDEKSKLTKVDLPLEKTIENKKKYLIQEIFQNQQKLELLNEKDALFTTLIEQTGVKINELIQTEKEDINREIQIRNDANLSQNVDSHIKKNNKKEISEVQTISLLHKSRYIRIFKNHLLINWKNTGNMRYYKFYHINELRNLIENVGFEIMKIETENESLNCFIKNSK